MVCIFRLESKILFDFFDWTEKESSKQNIPPKAPACANQNYTLIFLISFREIDWRLICECLSFWSFIMLQIYIVLYPLYPFFGQEIIGNESGVGGEAARLGLTGLRLGQDNLGHAAGWPSSTVPWSKRAGSWGLHIKGKSLPSWCQMSDPVIHNIEIIFWKPSFITHVFLIFEISAPHQGWSWNCTQSKGPLEIVKLGSIVESFSELARAPRIVNSILQATAVTTTYQAYQAYQGSLCRFL